MIEQTSLEAFEEIKSELPRARGMVFDIIKAYSDITNAEIAEALGWSINRVTPRVFELRQLGMVMFSQIRKCQITHRDVNAWKAKYGDEDLSIQDEEGIY